MVLPIGTKCLQARSVSFSFWSQIFTFTYCAEYNWWRHLLYLTQSLHSQSWEFFFPDITDHVNMIPPMILKNEVFKYIKNIKMKLVQVYTPFLVFTIAYIFLDPFWRTHFFFQISNILSMPGFECMAQYFGKRENILLIMKLFFKIIFNSINR